MSSDRLVPRPDADSAPYWDAATRGELLVRRCRACHKAHWYPRSHCPYCHADDPVWEATQGTGTIHSYTIVEQNGSRAFRELVPYVIGMVDLVEGPRWFGLLRGDPAVMEVGRPVVVAFDQVGDLALPVFEVTT